MLTKYYSESARKKQENSTPKIKSKRSEALGMYDKGATSLEIGTKLDISFQEAENYKIEYLKHQHMYEFEQLYKAKKDSLPQILSKLDELQDRNISLDLLSQALRLRL